MDGQTHGILRTKANSAITYDNVTYLSIDKQPFHCLGKYYCLTWSLYWWHACRSLPGDVRTLMWVSLYTTSWYHRHDCSTHWCELFLSDENWPFSLNHQWVLIKCNLMFSIQIFPFFTYDDHMIILYPMMKQEVRLATIKHTCLSFHLFTGVWAGIITWWNIWWKYITI